MGVSHRVTTMLPMVALVLAHCGSSAAPTSDAAPDAAPEVAEPAGPLTWQEATRRFQRRLLEDTLAQCGGNVSEAARRLELARSHLHELLRAHGLARAKG